MNPNDGQLQISAVLADRVAGELSPGERVVWLGQPRVDLAIRAAYFLVPIGFLMTGFALVWMLVAIFATGGLAAPCGLPFMVIGIAMLASPLRLRSMAQQTVYVLTDRRAIIWGLGWFGRVVVQSVTPAGMGQMSRVERQDGAGDLIFQIYTTGAGEDSRTVRRGFLGINEVRQVEALVRLTLLPNG